MSLTDRSWFQTGELVDFFLRRDIASFFIYFFLTISCQCPSFCSNFHHHLHNRLIFIFWRSFTPSPPFFFNWQTFFHLTRWYFFLVPPPCQKNLFLITFIFFRIVLGRRYIDMLYIGMLLRHAFSRVSLPPRDRTPPFQPSSLLLIFSTKGSQLDTCILFPTGTPRYLIGQHHVAQLNSSA